MDGAELTVLETPRLRLRVLVEDDAPFILELLNDPAWLRFIGDKGVRTLDDARAYIAKGPMDMVRRLGFGLYRVEVRDRELPIGICGLIKREALDDVDIGFAFLPRFRAQGFAREAAAAVLAYGRDVLSISRIVAITAPDNVRSIRVLEDLGLRCERNFRMPDDDHEVALYAMPR
jgi:ribosomal-protein-alanine N-acetyltransferase